MPLGGRALIQADLMLGRAGGKGTTTQRGEVSPVYAAAHAGKVGLQGDDCSEASTTDIATPSPAATPSDDSSYPCSSTLSAPPTATPSSVGAAYVPLAAASQPLHPPSVPRDPQPLARPPDPKQLPVVPRLLTPESAAATREASSDGRSSIAAAHRPASEARSDLPGGAAGLRAGALGRHGSQSKQEEEGGRGEACEGESQEWSSGGAVSGGKRRRSAAEEIEEVRVNRAAASARMRDLEVLARETWVETDVATMHS